MHKKPLLTKPLVAAAIGNALEWYDFGLYGYLALTLQKLFFPFANKINGLLSIFLVFAVGLFMRPLGGLVFGYIGDKIGRKAALVFSIATMALPTLFIGFLPTYQQIGIFAVILLVAARLLQGLAVGGEMIGSLVFLAEHAPSSRRGLAASLIYSVGTLGGLLGSLSGALLHLSFPEETILAWAWRLPFFLGIIVAGIGLYIRLKIGETPLFAKLIEEGKTTRFPFRDALKTHSKEIILIFLLISFQAVGFYMIFVYLSTWLTQIAHFSRASSLFINSIGLFFLVLFIPLFAALSDRRGRRKLLMSGAFCTCLIVYPLFRLLAAHSSYPLVLAALILFAFATALYQGPLAATLVELVSTKNRYMSLAIGYNSSAAFFGGLTPFLSTYLVEKTHHSSAPSFLLIATGAIAFFTVLFCIKETYQKVL